MNTTLGSASRARQLNNLFAVWKRASDVQDVETMGIARRAIDLMLSGNDPREADLAAIMKRAVRTGG